MLGDAILAGRDTSPVRNAELSLGICSVLL
jgi:hypothetical protein